MSRFMLEAALFLFLGMFLASIFEKPLSTLTTFFSDSFWNSSERVILLKHMCDVREYRGKKSDPASAIFDYIEGEMNLRKGDYVVYLGELKPAEIRIHDDAKLLFESYRIRHKSVIRIFTSPWHSIKETDSLCALLRNAKEMTDKISKMRVRLDKKLNPEGDADVLKCNFYNKHATELKKISDVASKNIHEVVNLLGKKNLNTPAFYLGHKVLRELRHITLKSDYYERERARICKVVEDKSVLFYFFSRFFPRCLFELTKLIARFMNYVT